MGPVSPSELYEGNLLHWGLRMICQVMLWKWASVSIGAPILENMVGCSFRRAFERKENFLYLGNFLREI
jgi:hypothetical protein